VYAVHTESFYRLRRHHVQRGLVNICATVQWFKHRSVTSDWTVYFLVGGAIWYPFSQMSHLLDALRRIFALFVALHQIPAIRKCLPIPVDMYLCRPITRAILGHTPSVPRVL
jgi:hypothetical protein